MAGCPDEQLFAVQPEATEFTSAEIHPPPRNATARLHNLFAAAAAAAAAAAQGKGYFVSGFSG